jgi:D-alanyl-D-alanine carboxypeptidase
LKTDLPLSEDYSAAISQNSVPEGEQSGTQENSSTKQEDWNLLLVNSLNPLPDDYTADLTELSNGQSVDSRIYPELQKMFDAARADGIYPVVASGYRTAEKQQSLMNEMIEAYEADGLSAAAAESEAKKWVAAPGFSEHQLGLAVDINADGVNSSGDEVYAWLREHACSYGFILRYPEDKTEITGTACEPWHYRYVGEEASAEIYNQGLCLEEFLLRSEKGKTA